MDSGYILHLTLLIGILSFVNGQRDFNKASESPNEYEYLYDNPEAVEMEYDLIQKSLNDHEKLPECSLDGLPLDTSPTRPYMLPPISDNVDMDIVLWTHPFTGSVNFTAIGASMGNTSQHFRYLRGTWLGGRYTISSNSLTKDFTRTFLTRILYRHVVLNCLPTGTKVRYHLNIPVQDMTPPEFQLHEYNFNITANWNRYRPISEGQFVIVGDNAYEIKYNDTFLQYSASLENFLRVVPQRLCVQPNPRAFHFHLNLYLEESVQLTAGQNIQVLLSVRDEFNSGSTKINIFVQ